MAQNDRLLPSQTLKIQFRDGTGTPLTYECTVAALHSENWQPLLPRGFTPVLGKSGGAARIHGINAEGITGPAPIKLKVKLLDPTNTADVTLRAILDSLTLGAAQGGLSSATWVSTNPLPDTTQFMVDFRLIWLNVASTTDWVQDLGAIYLPEGYQIQAAEGGAEIDLSIMHVEDVAYSTTTTA
ncbi:MAG TPA: hypothetical protein VEI97_14665 [bacterium]|nr:hypothetical protein [bacterium]